MLDSSDISTCLGECVQLQGIQGGSSYSWSPAAQVSDPTIANPEICADFLQNIFTVEVSSDDTSGDCASATFTYNINLTAAPEASSITQSEEAICKDSCIQLFGPINGEKYLWAPAIGLNSTTTVSVKACPDQTTDFVVATQTDTTLNCTYFDTISILVKDTCHTTEANYNNLNASLIYYLADLQAITVRQLQGENLVLSLYDLQGRNIQTIQIKQGFSTYSINNLSPGIYLATLSNEQLIYTLKISIN